LFDRYRIHWHVSQCVECLFDHNLHQQNESVYYVIHYSTVNGFQALFFFNTVFVSLFFFCHITFFQFNFLILFFYAIKLVNLFPSSQVLRKFFIIGFVLDRVKNLLVF